MSLKKTNNVNQISGIKELIAGIAIYISIFIFKYITGLITGSLTLRSDAFHSLIDSFGFFAIIFGIKIANRKPGEKYPFGLYKIESLLSLVVSIIVFYTGINFFIEAIDDFSPETASTLTFHPFALIIPGISVFLLLTDSFLLKKKAQITKSPTLKAESVNVRTDAFVNLAIFFGLIVAFYQFPTLDLILVIIIAGLIIYSGFEIFIPAIKDILDLSISIDDKEKIDQICNSDKNIEEIKRVLTNQNKRPFTLNLRGFIDSLDQIKGRSSGRYIFLEIELNVDPRLEVSEFSVISDFLEAKIRDQFPNIENILFEMIQKKPEFLTFAIPTLDKKGLDAQIGLSFGDAPFFAIIKASRVEIQDIDIRENPFKERERMKGILISEKLAEWGVNILVTKIELKKGPKIALSNFRIELVHLEDINSLNDISFSNLF